MVTKDAMKFQKTFESLGTEMIKHFYTLPLEERKKALIKALNKKTGRNAKL